MWLAFGASTGPVPRGPRYNDRPGSAQEWRPTLPGGDRPGARAHGPDGGQGFSKDRDEAEDLFQEVWVHVFDNRRSYADRGPFEAWLHRVALNVCRMEARRRRDRERGLERMTKEGVFEELFWTPPNPLGRVLKEEMLSILSDAIRNLPAREREAIDLRFLQDKTSREVAQAMGIEESTVRSLIRKGINRLKATSKG